MAKQVEDATALKDEIAEKDSRIEALEKLHYATNMLKEIAKLHKKITHRDNVENATGTEYEVDLGILRMRHELDRFEEVEKARIEEEKKREDEKKKWKEDLEASVEKRVNSEVKKRMLAFIGEMDDEPIAKKQKTETG